MRMDATFDLQHLPDFKAIETFQSTQTNTQNSCSTSLTSKRLRPSGEHIVFACALAAPP